jgi:hypothetical protein
MGGTRETRVVLAGIVLGLVSVAGLIFGLLGLFEASCLAAGGALATAILAPVTSDAQGSLYPAYLQLAKFRRSEKPADILVALPAGLPGARRRSARAARSTLRVSDGAAIVSSPRGYRLCAVLEPDARARSAIEHRLRSVCGDEVRVGWASFPEDGVTLESLIAAATDRISDHERARPGQPSPRISPGELPSPSLSPTRASIGGPIERH